MQQENDTLVRPAAVPSLSRAYQYCLQLARGHYENFPVASRLLPLELRHHVAAIYAFARTADDFADLQRDRQALQRWQAMLWQAAEKSPHHPVFVALEDTIQKFQLPRQWLDDLLQAFFMDLDFQAPRTWEDVLHYCRYSANPVGRILLWVFGHRSPALWPFSDAICSALQCTNFWQDLRSDGLRGRIYVPAHLLQQHGLSPEALIAGPSQAAQMVLAECVAFTRDLFRQGLPLLNHLRGGLKWQIRATIAGGLRVLHKIASRNYNVWHEPIRLQSRDWLIIGWNLIWRKP